ncbi:MAG TPA: biopolymer transporter ExbD [Thermoanaerobaculales bacterium]|nr:biopolymer transporter ExbD [Thermoanaerobaculales bacterium]HPA79865.1 biopolymer transporter ExbD [Thermoanaerobaculales bacterium]HQL28767.1 biopolymer transporter ExbD [Thermoanaerobaculales bacterium]HQN96123.1 biopolymer transporter ExbD [Thermoanaerobaculales bacterium]HQP42677.1 biopolymer transporter ExbD [Thermoanaerobaculales bacterium]
MKFTKKKLDSEIFTGSMADITFLLIIFFMLTMAFSSNRGMDFALPEDTTSAPEISQEESVDVLVLPGPVAGPPVIQVDGRSMPINQLLPYVADKLKQNPRKPVILRTDPGAVYGNMIAVFDELRQAETKVGIKIETISIPTQREIENIWTMLGIGP